MLQVRLFFLYFHLQNNIRNFPGCSRLYSRNALDMAQSFEHLMSLQPYRKSLSLNKTPKVAFYIVFFILQREKWRDKR